MNGLNLERRILDKTVYGVDSSDITQQILVSCISLFENWYINILLSLIRQFFLIPNEIKEFIDLGLCLENREYGRRDPSR
jgi:hypothetical protein